MKIFDMKAWSRPLQWVMVIVMILGLVLGSVAYTDVALAGSNGQLLKVGNACANPANLTWVRISGYNQYNRYAVWQAWPNAPTTITYGWYWVGRVKIEWRTNRDSYLHSTAADVPRSYERDDYRVILDKWGC